MKKHFFCGFIAAQDCFSSGYIGSKQLSFHFPQHCRTERNSVATCHPFFSKSIPSFSHPGTFPARFRAKARSDIENTWYNSTHTARAPIQRGEKKISTFPPSVAADAKRKPVTAGNTTYYSAHRDYVTHRAHHSKSGISSSTTSQQAFLDRDAPRAVRRLPLGGPGEEVRGPPPAHSQGSCHFQVKLMFSVHINSP